MAALQTSFEDFVKIGAQSSTMSIKADRTKLLFKLLMPWSSSVKAVAVYLKLKLKEHFVKFPPEIIPCACCWKSQSFLEIATFKFSWMETFCPMEADLGWDYGDIEWQHRRGLAIRIEKGCEGKRHWTLSKLCVKTLFTT